MKDFSQFSFSVVVPVYNEIDNVESLAREIDSVFAGHPHYEILFVDDHSQDGTRQKLGELAQSISNFKPLYHAKNFGQSASVLTGVRRAQYEWIVTLDGDGQNNPADIPALAAAIKAKLPHEAPIAACGNREKRDDTMIRRLSSTLANRVRGALLRDECPDTGCGLKCFRREDFLRLPHFNHVHRFLPALFKRSGGTVVNVPVSHRPRLHGQSKYGVLNRLGVGIIDMFGVVWLIRRPLNPESSNE
jgi:glycosyltransferase involved in cell wall biosynthesis